MLVLGGKKVYIWICEKKFEPIQQLGKQLKLQKGRTPRAGEAGGSCVQGN